MLLLLLFPIVSVAVVFTLAMVAGPIVDLVRRENAVRWWLHIPLLPTLLLPACVPMLLIDGVDGASIEDVSYLLAWFHFVVAGLLVFSAMALTVVRGLRPGGDTRRRLRTSVAAITVLVLIGVQPVLWAFRDEGMFFLLGWMSIASFAGVLWVLALNREGPYRLTEGKRWSAALLIVALHQFVLSASVFLQTLRSSYPDDWTAVPDAPFFWLTPVLLVLPLGLRYLAGPLPSQPFLMSLSSSATLVAQPVLVASWSPVDGDHELPAWVDLSGAPGRPLRLARHIDCVQYPGRPEVPCDDGWGQVVFAPTPTTPLSSIPRQDLLVGAGNTVVSGPWAYGTPRTIHEQNGLARIDDRPELYPLGPQLHDALRRLDDRVPLLVDPSPRWTAQDFVSICASYPWECTLNF